MQALNVAAFGGVKAALQIHDRPSTIIKTEEAAQFETGLGIPEAGGLVFTAREHPLAVRREGHGCDIPSMPLEATQLLAGLCLPEPCRLVPASRQPPLAIRREGNRCDPV